MRSEYLFLELTFVVVEAGIETRIWKLETRASCFELLASIRTSPPEPFFLTLTYRLFIQKILTDLIQHFNSFEERFLRSGEGDADIRISL
jgi:hypothetical protein